MSKNTKNKYTVRCLAFGGDATRIMGYPGFYKAFEERGLREDLKYVTGSAAAAITATIVALGASSEYFEKFMMNGDGICNSHFIYSVICNQIKELTYPTMKWRFFHLKLHQM